MQGRNAEEHALLELERDARELLNYCGVDPVFDATIQTCICIINFTDIIILYDLVLKICF